MRCRFLHRLLFFSHKEQMIGHADTFRLFADVEVVPQILLIGSFIQPIDEILQQFAGTIG